MFYFQRCRTALTEPYAVWKGNSYTRKGPCHAHEDVGWDMADYPAKKHHFVMDAGWHDAGNFDMYVCSTAPTCQALLLAYERHPDLFKDMNLNIPESGNGTPDILNECRWGLRWVLCMQDENGGFHARDAVYDWSPEGPADKDMKTRWVANVGTASTAKACAALALAARVYVPFDKAFAERCSQAALKGWAFLKKHPEHILVDGHGSEQTLWDESKDFPSEAGCRLAAAVEMWRTFKQKTYLEAAQNYLKEPQTQPNDFLRGAWVDIARWPVIELAEDPTVPVDLRLDCGNRVLAACITAMSEVKKDGYRSCQGLGGYIWSSNEIMMQEALLLSECAKLDPSRAWARDAARDQWHWMLGRNPNGYSMVTGIGKEPTALYHCEWTDPGEPPPGYMEGGPNSHEAGFLAPGAPAKCLLWDNPKSLTSGLPAHHLWHAKESDLWDGGFLEKDKWTTGWWTVTEPDINSNADFILAAVEFQE
jgi:endoglucanase